MLVPLEEATALPAVTEVPMPAARLLLTLVPLDAAKVLPTPVAVLVPVAEPTAGTSIMEPV